MVLRDDGFLPVTLTLRTMCFDIQSGMFASTITWVPRGAQRSNHTRSSPSSDHLSRGQRQARARFPPSRLRESLGRMSDRWSPPGLRSWRRCLRGQGSHALRVCRPCPGRPRLRRGAGQLCPRQPAGVARPTGRSGPRGGGHRRGPPGCASLSTWPCAPGQHVASAAALLT